MPIDSCRMRLCDASKERKSMPMPNDCWSVPDCPMGHLEWPMEPHLPCAIICDVSKTMEQQMDELNESLVQLLKTIFKNNTARGRVEISILAYDHEVKMVTPFQSMYDYWDCECEIPRLTIRNSDARSTYVAMKRALDAINERRETYRANCTPCYHPVIFLLAGGRATDKPEDGERTVSDELLDLQINRYWNYVPIAIGDECDIDEMTKYQKNHKVIHIERTDGDIGDVFVAIGQAFGHLFRARTSDESDEIVWASIFDQCSSSKLTV